MKVAIMGAGLAGLSCAITLESNGINPTIFEKRNMVGDRFVNAESMFSILNRPIKDPLAYLSDKYNINLTPIAKTEKLVFHSKEETSSVNGNLGYSNIRGRHENSFECQLQKQIKSEINFKSKREYENLCREYDYVVLATGDGDYSCHLGNYRCDLTCTLKGATVVGDFITSISHVWFDYEVMPKGFAFLIPFSETEANFVINYPDYPQTIKLDINYLWQQFYNKAEKDLDQSLRITDRFEVTKYMLGICNHPKIENTYFVGNCFGTISPGLGFGQFTSILTGIYSAYDLCGIGKYEELVKPLFENYEQSLILRKYLEDLDDNNLNKIVKRLDNKLIDGLIDRLISSKSKIDLLKDLTPFMRLINNFKEN